MILIIGMQSNNGFPSYRTAHGHSNSSNFNYVCLSFNSCFEESDRFLNTVRLHVRIPIMRQIFAKDMVGVSY